MNENQQNSSYGSANQPMWQNNPPQWSAPQNGPVYQQPAQTYYQPPVAQQQYTLVGHVVCARCGCPNVTINVMQENAGSQSVTMTKGTIKQKGHGIIWWLFVGWWKWIFDAFMWIFAFPLKAIMALTKKKKYKVKQTATTTQQNQIRYVKVCTCQNCGNVWRENA